MSIPDHFTAGDSVSWRVEPFTLRGTQTYVSAPAWSLSLAIRGPIATGLDLVGTADGSGWTFDISSAQSGAMNASPAVMLWAWQLKATLTGKVTTVGRGVTRVRPNLAALAPTATFDGRSQAEQDLAAVEAEIRARVQGGATLEYTIGQRSLKKEPLSELLKLRSHYQVVVRRERAGGRVSDLQVVQVQFR